MVECTETIERYQTALEWQALVAVLALLLAISFAIWFDRRGILRSHDQREFATEWRQFETWMPRLLFTASIFGTLATFVSLLVRDDFLAHSWPECGFDESAFFTIAPGLLLTLPVGAFVALGMLHGDHRYWRVFRWAGWLSYGPVLWLPFVLRWILDVNHREFCRALKQRDNRFVRSKFQKFGERLENRALICATAMYAFYIFWLMNADDYMSEDEFRQKLLGFGFIFLAYACVRYLRPLVRRDS